MARDRDVTGTQLVKSISYTPHLGIGDNQDTIS